MFADGCWESPLGEVRVDGERITAVSAADQPLARDGVQIVDGAGAMLIPGLVESHAHLSFTDFAQSVELGFIPPEEHVLATAANGAFADNLADFARNLFD